MTRIKVVIRERHTTRHQVLAYGLVASLSILSCPATTAAQSAVSYTTDQANAGQAQYRTHCASCHGENLTDGQAPSLSGAAFQAKWRSRSYFDLFTLTRTTMPAAAPGTLANELYANILAYVFSKNSFRPGPRPLPTDRAGMSAITFPFMTFNAAPDPAIVLPPNPNPTPNPLDKLTPLSERDVRDPDPKDWVTWRRTPAGDGYSPLDQINQTTVARLQVAWSWSLPNGGNQTTPLVHDGVLYAFGHGDIVQALNAKTGDRLWEYRRLLPEGMAPQLKKSIALYGDKVYVTTTDFHLVALDAKTGKVTWDVQVEDGTDIRPAPMGGPLVAKGKIILGTRYPFTRGDDKRYAGGMIIAFDAESGKKIWTFNTIAGAGEPGGDTWNNLPRGQRSGGSVWTPGSYDPETDLLFFGAAQTYDTAPLRVPVEKDQKSINSALYTNSTLALNPDTGRLVWYYQHLPNDQWDLDFAFERQVVTLPVGGEMRRVVVTAGKPAIYEALDARTGKYLWSWDAGVQNFITAIDPKTGDKTYDPKRIPGDGKEVFVCPHLNGAKNWLPAAINPNTKILYGSIVEACMNMKPAPEGQLGLLSEYSANMVPPVNSDGKYGRFLALDLTTQKVAWVDRQRAPFMTGALATGGGVVFAGSVDRQFVAFDDATGQRLWQTRLNSVPHAAPITYLVDGKQYVAVVVGGGGPYANGFRSLTPEISNPVNLNSTIWVFALPDATDAPSVTR